MRHILTLIIVASSMTAFSQSTKQLTPMKPKDQCTADCCKSGSKPVLACKLTSPELQKRKATVLASLKEKILDRKETATGFQYQFKGDDQLLDELTTFIKTERQCCDFFDFGLTVKGDGTLVLLDISGPKGAKEFIKTELDL